MGSTEQSSVSRFQARAAASLLVLCLGGMLVAGSSSGCARPSPAASEESAAPAPPSVTIVQPARRTLQRIVEQPGWIQAFERAPLYAKISGYVQKVNVEIGSRVHKGDVLAELWVPEMVQDLRQKEALISQAQAEVEQSDKALKAADADCRSAAARVKEAEAGRARVQAEFERSKSQFERFTKAGRSGILATETVEETQLGLAASRAALAETEAKILSAQAARDESQAKREKAQADLNVARAHEEVAKVNRDHAQTLLQYAQVRAPFDGVVTDRQVDTGHFLQLGSGGNGKAEPLFVVARMDSVRIFVDVPETDAIFVQQGCPARIRIQALKTEEVEGKVAGTSWALRPGDRTLRAEIDMSNPDGKLRPGMYAYASLSVCLPDVLAVPAAAVKTNEGQAYCFFLEDGKAMRTRVTIGNRVGDWVQVLKKQPKTSGGKTTTDLVNFTGAEQILVPVKGSLVDGQAVRVTAQ